jgi:DNA-binding response OmpR family regulator
MCRRSILVIEYEADIREILHTCLSEFDSWKVILSSSIQEGIRLCKILPPDAILLDTSTSEADALLFVEELKQQSISKSIPILLISARANWFSKRELHQMGFAGAITKPFKPSTLPAQVARLLGWNEPSR